MSENSAPRKFKPFSNWWVGPDRQAIVDRYLECQARDIEEDEQQSDGCIVMLMMAPLEYQWQIVLALVRGVVERKLGLVAAGPLEACLAKFGEELIDRVEAEAARSPKFRRALGDVWQNAMSDEVYARVRRAAS